MLEEAVEVIRELFSGQLITHHGKHYRIDTARLYSLPDSPPPVFMSGFGEKAIKLLARLPDGYICVQPNPDFVRLYRDSGGGDRPVQGGLKVCWDTDAGQARKTMHRLWPNETSRGSAPTPTPDSTRCTSARSAPGTPASSSSTPIRCHPACARRDGQHRNGRYQTASTKTASTRSGRPSGRRVDRGLRPLYLRWSGAPSATRRRDGRLHDTIWSSRLPTRGAIA